MGGRHAATIGFLRDFKQSAQRPRALPCLFFRNSRIAMSARLVCRRPASRGSALVRCLSGLVGPPPLLRAPVQELGSSGLAATNTAAVGHPPPPPAPPPPLPPPQLEPPPAATRPSGSSARASSGDDAGRSGTSGTSGIESGECTEGGGWAEEGAQLIDLLQFGAFCAFVTNYVANSTQCVGPSMMPTIGSRGDIVLTVPFATYRWATEALSGDHARLRGAVIISTSPTNPSQTICKRVHGLPGADLPPLARRRGRGRRRRGGAARL